jgi:hypothetical protein
MKKNSLVFTPIKTHETSWEASDAVITLNIVIDRTDGVEISDGSGKVESRCCNLIVLDSFFGEKERVELLDFITESNWDHKQGPPEKKWERLTSDGIDLPKTWGVKDEILAALATGTPPAIVEIGSRMTKLYPNYHVVPQPPNDWFVDSQSSESSYSCEQFVANAAVHGDSFRWHVDADPDSFPKSRWVDFYGNYVNHEPGKPLFVSLLLYLDKFWPRNFDAETLFLDDETETGVFVRPKAYRAVLMDQDVLHRLSAPSSKVVAVVCFLHVRSGNFSGGCMCSCYITGSPPSLQSRLEATSDSKTFSDLV